MRIILMALINVNNLRYDYVLSSASRYRSLSEDIIYPRLPIKFVLWRSISAGNVAEIVPWYKVNDTKTSTPRSGSAVQAIR